MSTTSDMDNIAHKMAAWLERHLHWEGTSYSKWSWPDDMSAHAVMGMWDMDFQCLKYIGPVT